MSTLPNLDNLLQNVITTADRQAFLSALDEVSTSLFTKDGTKSLPESLINFLKANQVDLSNSEFVRDFLEVIKDQVQDLPQVGLTCALDWSDSSRQNLSNWFTRNLGQHVVLDLTVDKNVIGGAVVEFSGVRKDFTLVARLSSRTPRSGIQ